MKKEQYIKVDDMLDELRCLAADHFSVVDPTYQTYLSALDNVELSVARIRKYETPEVRVGRWKRERPGSYRFNCSICGFPVFFPKHQDPCDYPHCPGCRTRMEVSQ